METKVAKKSASFTEALKGTRNTAKILIQFEIECVRLLQNIPKYINNIFPRYKRIKVASSKAKYSKKLKKKNARVVS